MILLFGLLIAIPTWYVSGYRWGLYLGKKYDFKVSDVLLGPQQDEADAAQKPASPAVVITLMLIPMFLIFGNTGLKTLATAGIVDGKAGWVEFFVFLGQTSIALLITTVVAMILLGLNRGMDKTSVEKLMEGALGPICSVVLITGAGGMFGGVLRTSGIGDALADSLSNIGIPVILACYLISVALRLAQGSATVALTTAAALMAPAVEVANFNAVQLALIVLATAAGSVFGSHVNDSGFWLVGRLMGMDVATTLRTWTVNQVMVSAIGFTLVLVCYGLAGVVS